MSTTINQNLRNLPRVDELRDAPLVAAAATDASPTHVLNAVRDVLDQERASLLAGNDPHSFDALCEKVVATISAAERLSLRPVINATGVVIHTNLGRSVLSEKATQAVTAVARSYSTLEFDVETGQRGSRHAHVESLLCELTGAEAACVVNNNAAAVMLVIDEVAKGKSALVSRGELIEIGGSFRIPDIMNLSGARMIEVGTTNKTHLSDYEDAFDYDTALVLKVHPSNYRIVGFTETPTAQELVEFAHARGAFVYEDQGSGVLFDLSKYGLPYERTVQDALQGGVDVVSCSGDKLLGGAQAGLIFGSKALIARIKKNPFMRALRPDKLTLAALEVTLRESLDEARAMQEIPTLKMLTMTYEELATKAESFAQDLRAALTQAGVSDVEVLTFDETSRAGGGALPAVDLPTKLVALKLNGALSADKLQHRLMTEFDRAVITRIVKDQLCVDMRTILRDDERTFVLEALTHCLSSK